LRKRRQHRLVVAALVGRGRRLVALADDQPVLRVARELCRDEGPRAVQPRALEPDGQAAVPLLLDELVRAGIPDLDGPRAVLALRDHAFEAGVLERVVLDVDGEVLLAGLERDTLRHCPARERPIPLEAE